MVKVRTGKGWKNCMIDNSFYSPEIEDGKYYMLNSYAHTKDFKAQIYTFEEVEIID